MDDETDDNTLIIDFEYDTKLIRIVNNSFVTSNIKIRAELIPLMEQPDHDEFDISLSKCKFWLDMVFSKCIVFYRDNTQAKEIMFDENGTNRCSNYIMLTPSEPSDDHIACLLQSKLSAIGATQFAFGSIRIMSDSANGLIFRFIGDAADNLPSVREWIGERSYFEQPWWNRDDISTLDVIPSEDADLSEKPSWASNFDFLTNAMRGTSLSPKDVIVRPDFKPKVIKGGKDDNDK
jgi:hypothetical protein